MSDNRRTVAGFVVGLFEEAPQGERLSFAEGSYCNWRQVLFRQVVDNLIGVFGCNNAFPDFAVLGQSAIFILGWHWL